MDKWGLNMGNQRGASVARYRDVDEVKVEGAHYTPPILAAFVARQIVSALGERDKDAVLSIVDPAVGDGELVLALLHELREQGYRHPAVSGFDTSSAALEIAGKRIRSMFPAIEAELCCRDFLDVVLSDYDTSQMRLFKSGDSKYYDLLIANPPYVRTQVLGAETAQNIARGFGLNGRVDLYHAFLCGVGRILKPGAIAGIIVSNRFMTTRSGAAVRSGILQHFDPLHIWDFGDTRLFSAAVLPAVLLLSRKAGDHARQEHPLFSSIYSNGSAESHVVCSDPVEAMQESGNVRLISGEHFHVQHGHLYFGKAPGDVWRIETESGSAWLDRVATNTWCTFRDIGDIRVGVKTTADKVFIRKDWHAVLGDEVPELLMPLITHHVARRFRPLEPAEQRQILYTHKVVGGRRCSVDLAEYPRSADYLEKYRATEHRRKYVIEAGRNWYEIWVPQDPAMWRLPKVAFRDISERPTFWMDLGGSVVNGDCYWLCVTTACDQDILWLALAVANSSFTEAFYDRKFNNKLYAGRRRFMTQYVEQFPVPNPARPEAKQMVALAKRIYEITPSDEGLALEQELDTLVWDVFS